METTWVSEHPQYDDWTLEYDVVILRTERSLVFSERIRSANLPTPNFQVTGEATVSGWGALEWGTRNFPDILQSAVVPSITNAQCQVIYDEEDILPQHLCAGIEGRDACQGKN